MAHEEAIRTEVNGTVQKTFYPHKILENGDILTIRMTNSLILVPGAELWHGDEFLGLVNCVKRAPMDRWLVGVVFPVADGEVADPLPEGLQNKHVTLLQGAGILTFSQLIDTSRAQLIAIRGIGEKTADEILEVVAAQADPVIFPDAVDVAVPVAEPLDDEATGGE